MNATAIKTAVPTNAPELIISTIDLAPINYQGLNLFYGTLCRLVHNYSRRRILYRVQEVPDDSGSNDLIHNDCLLYSYTSKDS